LILLQNYLLDIYRNYLPIKMNFKNLMVTVLSMKRTWTSTAPSSANQGQAGDPGATANLQAATQASQLVSAMATFGATPTADTQMTARNQPVHLPLGVDPSTQAHRHA
jgi:hypothetical protein